MMNKIMDQFTDEEQSIILEASLVSLRDSMTYEMLADELDLSDEVLFNLREKINRLSHFSEHSICKHCNEPICLSNDGVWVHHDEDEDPEVGDYGWVKCKGGEAVAEPTT